jgi:aromatic ring-opening dioxygenase LigB subunit
MKKPIIIKFDAEAHKEFKHLQEAVAQRKRIKKKPTYEQLLTSINNALKNIKVDYRYGDLIPRRLISKATIERYGTDKIFRVELVGFWRLLYTIIGDEAKIIAFILEYLDHDKYNKIFGYKKR